MKVAIIFRGQYFRTGKKATSFFRCIDNQKQNLLSYFKNYDLFFQSTSVDKETDQKLINSLSFKKYDFTNKNRNTLDSILNSLKIYDFSKYDLIVCVRFDLCFFQHLRNFKIDVNKFNFLWKEPKQFEFNGMVRVCDHLIIFPPKYLPNFEKINYDDSNIVKTIKGKVAPHFNNRSHHLNQFLYLTEDDTNFMIDGHHFCGCSNAKRDVEARKYVIIERRINI